MTEEKTMTKQTVSHSQPATTLLPCPFCGGEAGYFASDHRVFRAEWTGHIYHCTQCQGRVQNTDRQTAQTMWNTRAAPQGADTRDAEYRETVRRVAAVREKRMVELREALQEAVAVFESWHDDETEVELLPRLREVLRSSTATDGARR